MSISRLLQNASNARTVMHGLATELETMTADNFDSESFGRQAWVRKAFGGGKTLTNTGELRDSITSSASSTTATIGTNVKYARIHHFGGTIQAKNKPYLAFATPNGFARVKSVDLPSRPFLPVSPNGELQSGGDDRLLEVALQALTSGTKQKTLAKWQKYGMMSTELLDSQTKPQFNDWGFVLNIIRVSVFCL